MADSHAGIQGYTRMYLTTDMGAHTCTHQCTHTNFQGVSQM